MKLGFFITLLIVPALLFQGCARDTEEVAAATRGMRMEDSQISAEALSATSSDPEQLLDDIFIDVDVRGIEEADETVLFEKFGISEDLYQEQFVRYSNGRYGLADVFILQPYLGQEEALHEALVQTKLNRIVEFKNYDIYNALAYAEDGQIFDVDGYTVLVMMENAEEVRSLIEASLVNAE